jgi:hypothetical protein
LDKIILFDGCEPPLMNNVEDLIIKFHPYFDRIYTRNKNILSKCKNSYNFIFGSSWVLTDKLGKETKFKQDYNNIFSTQKKFKTSFIRSSKKFLPGHKLRYEIDSILNEKREYELYFPTSLGHDDKKLLFLDSMFHICIENSQFDNYITEKIIDCFMSYTIPIYWGAPNVSDYFDKKGILTFQTKSDLENILNNLSESLYQEMLPSITKNYQIAYDNYAFFFDRINTIINEL